MWTTGWNQWYFPHIKLIWKDNQALIEQDGFVRKVSSYNLTKWLLEWDWTLPFSLQPNQMKLISRTLQFLASTRFYIWVLSSTSIFHKKSTLSDTDKQSCILLFILPAMCQSIHRDNFQIGQNIFCLSIKMSDFSRTFKGKIPLPSPLSVLVNGSRGRAE